MKRPLAFLLVLISLLASACTSTPGLEEYEEATRLYKAGKRDEAVEAARLSLDENPNAIPSRWLIATIYEEQGKWREAVQELQEVLKTLPQFIHAGNRIGEILVRHGLRAKAKEYFEACLEQDENYFPARMNLGMMAYQGGDTDVAIFHLDRATKAHPGIAQAHLHLANVLHSVGREDEARAQVKAALECEDLRPEDRQRIEKLLSSKPE
ncbi:MAG: tetratricopeptide repeat protein [Planctomycetota bacterium]|jgi:tetratricopeptide (TPR) repeat protein